MRKALNENPMVQVGVLAVAAIAFAFILFTSVLKKEEPPPADTEPAAATASSTSAAPATPDSTPVAPATASPSVAPTPSAVAPDPAAAAPSGGGSVADGLLPSKGLPKDLLVAFAKNKTIALLVIDPKGVSDKKVKGYTEALRSRDDVAVFIADVKDIADYSRVTAGVAVNRVPALVVIRPRKLTGSVPTATVAYGFRGGRSVSQAIDDSLYEGKQVPAYP